MLKLVCAYPAVGGTSAAPTSHQCLTLLCDAASAWVTQVTSLIGLLTSERIPRQRAMRESEGSQGDGRHDREVS